MKISVMIPTYNCSQYIEKTITSVLEQNNVDELLQIEVIDDCSSDNIEEIVQRIGRGKVSFYKQQINVGHVKNFETAINRAKGDIIHLLHGDDFVLPGFYKSMLDMFKEHPYLGAIFCRHYFVDNEDNIIQISDLLTLENSIITDFHKELIFKQKIQTPSITVKKEVYEKLGYFNPSLTWTEDWEMWVRICSKYKIGYIKEPLASYRVHNNSSTGIKSISGENVKDLYRLKEEFKKYVENKTEIKRLNNSFRKTILMFSTRNYKASLVVGDKKAYKHLLEMAKNAGSLKMKLGYYLNYWAKRLWILA